MEMFTQLLSDPTGIILGAVAAFIAWQTRHQSRVNEQLWNDYRDQYEQFQSELPKLREALQDAIEIIASLKSHLSQTDSEYRNIINKNLSEINRLKSKVNDLEEQQPEQRRHVDNLRDRLSKCETTRRMMAKYLEKQDPALYKELIDLIGTDT